jgi:beta-lactamase regulating signal transducer with metallopeptidase domain
LNKKKGMNADIQWLCNELISALIQGGAQGALIIGLMWGCLKIFPRANAATRHGAWFATLIIAAAIPAVIFTQSAIERYRSTLEATAPNRATAATPVDIVVREESIVNIGEPAFGALTNTSSQETLPSLDSQSSEGFSWRFSIPSKVSSALVAGWLLLSSIRIGVLAAQLVVLRRIKRSAQPASEALAEPFAEAVTNMRISRRPTLLISDRAVAPMVVGYLKPAMLLPKFIADRCSGIQLEPLFRHELAHLARRDDWTNLLQQIIAAVFFFHPGILFVSRRMTAEREIACDDHALAIGRAPREYALFLTEFASQMKSRDFAAAPAAWSSNSQLKERIGMILNGKRNASPRVSRVGVSAMAATAATLAVAAVMLTPRLVVAAEEPETLTIEAPVAPSVEVSVAAATPVVRLTPAVIAVAPALPTPEVIPVTSITTSPREKGPLKVEIAPRPMPKPAPSATPKMAFAPEGERVPEPRPRIKVSSREDREDRDVERRIERLERLVEELRNSLKNDKRPGDGAFFNNKNFNADLNAQIHEQMEKAHREAERAQHQAQRAMREQSMAFQNQFNFEHDRGRATQLAGRESLKARRQALEAQRKQIEKELSALEKEMDKNEAEQDKRKEEEKRNKLQEKQQKQDKQEKQEKKTRDTGKDSDDDSKN